jgi:hypothetical protein
MVGNGQDSPLRSSEAGLADATGLPVISIPVANPSLRVDELALARLVDQGFEEGHEALGRLRAALELLERREHECATGHNNDAEGSEGSEGTMGTMGTRHRTGRHILHDVGDRAADVPSRATAGNAVKRGTAHCIICSGQG